MMVTVFFGGYEITFAQAIALPGGGDMSLSAAYCLRHPLTVVTIRKFFASDSSSPLPVLAILLFATDDTGRFL